MVARAWIREMILMRDSVHMTPEEQQLEAQAREWVKSHAREIIAQFCGSCVKVNTPISLFMAGSPGAGKTEVSRSLMNKFETVPVRVDADEIRAMCPGYTGGNAHVFQKAASKGVNILYDHALASELHVIMDGTFAYGNALENIKRSLDKKRKVELWFIYQDPLKAWEFTKARESLESRHVSKDQFIQAFLCSKTNTIEAKRSYPDSLILNLLVKNIDNSEGELQLNVQSDELDRYIARSYTAEELATILN